MPYGRCCASNCPIPPDWSADRADENPEPMSPLFIVQSIGFGALIGLSLGALGAGGSILTVPILVYVMGVPLHSATGTSLAIVGLNAAAGALEHLRRGRSLPRTGFAF